MHKLRRIRLTPSGFTQFVSDTPEFIHRYIHKNKIHSYNNVTTIFFMSYATKKKNADQPALPRRLSSIFVVRCLDSIMVQVVSLKFQDLCLSLTWSQTSEDMFSHDVAQLRLLFFFVI